MVPRALALPVAALFLSLAFAGCLKGDEPVDASTTNETETPVQPTVLPDGREFTAVEETNKTEEGVGGMDHKHDYWNGKENVVIYDFDVTPDLTPVFERGDNSKAFVAFINLEKLPEDAGKEDDDARDALVFEGTGLVSFTITSAPGWSDAFSLTFRTAAKDWSTPQPIRVGEQFDYVPEKIETDMPHSFRSLWNWKLQATGPVPVTGNLFGLLDDTSASQPIHVTISVTKASNVDDWPGHPAFYDGVAERIVVNNAVGRTDVQQAADVLVYGIEPDQVVPEKLVSMGTHTLDVYVNITKMEMPPGVDASGFQLFWRTAATRPNDLGYSNHNNETDGKTWAYWHLTVPADEVDSPYQPESRFSFKVLVTPADDSVVYCYRCVPYNIEYTISVIARPDPEASPVNMDM